MLKGRNTLHGAYARYDSNAYFDGKDEFPHSSTNSSESSSYTRDELTLTYSRDIGHNTRVVAMLPASKVRQRGIVAGEWRVEHLWVGTLHMRTDRQGSLLLALGLPLAGGIDSLSSANADEDNDARVAAMTIFTNGFVENHWAHYARIGAIAHLGTGDYDQSVYELQGEAHLAPALGLIHLGLRIDAKFTLVSDDSESTPLSHDAVAIGPILHCPLSDRIAVSMLYREEIFGYYASAGSAFRLSLDTEL